MTKTKYVVNCILSFPILIDHLTWVIDSVNSEKKEPGLDMASNQNIIMWFQECSNHILVLSDHVSVMCSLCELVFFRVEDSVLTFELDVEP